MPQPQSSLNEIQMLQRQLMLKNLQELHRQKKLQELNDASPQNLVNHQSLLHIRPAQGASPFINGTPVRDASQMFMFGNTFPNGLVYSQPQNQVFQSSFGPYSHFHMASHADVLTEQNYGHAEDVTKAFMNDQFNVSANQERNLFGHDFTQMGNDRNASLQEFSGGQEQAGWQCHFSGKTENVDSSQGLATLDPLEQKILFDTDGFNMGTGGFENMLENTDNSGDIPSLQSGSWSALMQSAVGEASSNDTGPQEEWNGLSFQNSELSSNNLQNASSKPEILNTSNASSGFPGFQPQLQFVKNENTRSDSFQTSHNMLELLHKVDRFGEFRPGTQPGYNNSAPTTEVPQAKPADALSLASPSFGLRLAPPTQRSTMNYFDPSQISQHPGHSVETLQVVQSSTFEAKPCLTGFGFSTGLPNVWVDVPAHQNISGMGSRKGPGGSPSTSDASEGNNVFEHGAYVMNSQGFDYGKSQPHAPPQHYSLLNPVHSDPINIQPKSASGNHKTPPVSSASRDSLVQNSFQDDVNVQNSWFKDYGAEKTRQTSENFHRFSSLGQVNLGGADPYGGVWPDMGAQTRSSSPYLQHLDMANRNLAVLKSKKRKFPTFELLPWHKEAAKGSSRPQVSSFAELEWAQASNRLPDKLKEEDEAIGDSLRTVQPKKRLTITTQLMQILFRPPPGAILSLDGDTVTYFAARLALGDACSLANHSHTPQDVSFSSPEKSVSFKKKGDGDFLKIVEDFIVRTKRLEDELLRLESRGSILDTRVGSQELEKFSIINRFAKFHSRGQAESASSGPKLYPQRYVTASPMPKTLPEGQHCLLL